MCLRSRSSLYVRLAWMMDWNGRDSFLTATLKPVFVSNVELRKKEQHIMDLINITDCKIIGEFTPRFTSIPRKSFVKRNTRTFLKGYVWNRKIIWNGINGLKSMKCSITIIKVACFHKARIRTRILMYYFCFFEFLKMRTVVVSRGGCQDIAMWLLGRSVYFFWAI